MLVCLFATWAAILFGYVAVDPDERPALWIVVMFAGIASPVLMGWLLNAWWTPALALVLLAAALVPERCTTTGSHDQVATNCYAYGVGDLLIMVAGLALLLAIGVAAHRVHLRRATAVVTLP
jgi:hypothetical protein